MTGLIRVMLADDHTLVRAGIRSLLHEIPDIEVVGEAGDGLALLALVAANPPDIVLLDIGMPRMSGLEVVPHLSKINPSIRAVMLSIHRAEEYVIEAWRAGAAGYLLKDSAVPELEIALRAVARGERYLSPAVSEAVVTNQRDRFRATTADTLALLTPREGEILQLVARGLTSKEIAQRLGISYRTVEVHRMHLMRRLDVHDVTALVRFAVGAGLLV
jgi:DNA-binding NarL/FixJ family response regulator